MKTQSMKASMSGQDIPLFDRIRSSWNILRAYRNGVFGNVSPALAHHRHMLDVMRRHAGVEPKDATILDVGSGQMAQQTALFLAEGARVVGVDLEFPTYRMNPKVFFEVAKRNGVERAVKSAVRHVLFDRKYMAELSKQLGKPVPFEQVEVRAMDADALEFPDDHFDFVHSSWVFEHVENVRGAIREISRVLKPTGVAWIGTHLFPSLSGGHHLDWIRPGEQTDSPVSPWDHLLDNQFPVNTYLNRLRLDEYREIFDSEVEVIEEMLTHEGEEFLTPELEATLLDKGYTRQDLTTRTHEIVCRRKSD